MQDNHCRVIVASSDPSARLPITRRTGRAPDPNAPCLADIAVKYGANPVLPAPHRKWVNMSYRVRGGRLGTGLIEIHANGRFIARITGSIGYDHAKGPNQYFKFGIYRNLAPGMSIARFADFRRTGRKPMEFGQSAKLTP